MTFRKPSSLVIVSSFGSSFSSIFRSNFSSGSRALFSLFLSTIIVAISVGTAQIARAATTLSPIQRLGKQIFFDDISNPDRMGCSSCHDPRAGWTGPSSYINARGAVMFGAIRKLAGNRKPPAVSYATFSPFRLQDCTLYGAAVQARCSTDPRTGGNFWDGRATGEELVLSGILAESDPYWQYLGPAADQALKPFENHLEQNISKQEVCRQVATSGYAFLYRLAWGQRIDCSDAADGYEVAFKRIAVSIAAYESADEVAPFASKFDKGKLNKNEQAGMDLFTGKAGCTACHTLTNGLFTNFRAQNLGVPRNPMNPWYEQPDNPLGRSFVDGGQLDVNGNPTGRFKTPTLRNVDKRPRQEFIKAYMHNGYFKSLEAVVHFYNTRDVLPRCADMFTTEVDALKQNCWPEPEFNANIAAFAGVGNLGLTHDEELRIVDFLKALTDQSDIVLPDGRRISTLGL